MSDLTNDDILKGTTTEFKEIAEELLPRLEGHGQKEVSKLEVALKAMYVTAFRRGVEKGWALEQDKHTTTKEV